jgi:hypothetical protein
MIVKDGVGFTNACRIDDDTEARINVEMTNDRGKQQLFTRLFTGSPNINKGGFEPELDAQMTQGSFSIKKENCDILSEKSFDRFEPMREGMLKNIQSANNIVPEWKWGGEGTRDVMSQRGFLENNGYAFDGNVWAKKC